jgi:N-acyl-D-amino-acid deacylase
MEAADGGWENFFRAAGPDGMRFVRFRNPSLRVFTGKTLREVSTSLAMSPAQAAMHLVVEDDSRVETAYFFMSEENLAKQVVLPWVSFASDAMAMAPEGVFLEWTPHPRAYGTFARVFRKYVREDGLLPLEEAVRRMTSLPAENLGLADRGRLAPGCAADVVVFDPDAIGDEATYDTPHRYATGVRDVAVNGVFALRDGEQTGALPGRAIRGRGWRSNGS